MLARTPHLQRLSLVLAGVFVSDLSGLRTLGRLQSLEDLSVDLSRGWALRGQLPQPQRQQGPVDTVSA